MDKSKELQNINLHHVTCTVYFDLGHGFEKANTHRMPGAIKAETGNGLHIVDDIVIPDDCQRIRIDPCENYLCFIEYITIISNGNAIKPLSSNGTEINGRFIFSTEDPQIIVALPKENEHFLHLDMYIRLYHPGDPILPELTTWLTGKDDMIQELNSQKEILEQKTLKLHDLNIEKQKEIQGLQDLTKKIIQDNNILIADLQNNANYFKTQYENVQKEYERISNSTFWKITKPGRVCLDGIKKQLMKNRKLFLSLLTLKWRITKGKAETERLKKEYIKWNQTDKIWYDNSIYKMQQNTSFSKDITFSILVPLYNTPKDFLRGMIESVLKQTYSEWELCLADGSDEEHTYIEKICRQYIRKDHRIKYRKLEKNLGISGNTNACIEMATGNFIALLDHDDVLHPYALYEVMKAICEQDADFVFTDEATFKSPNLTKLVSIHYKPHFAPDNLLANNYICHFSAFSAQLLQNAGGFRSEYNGSQDHDIILRLTDAANKVVHIPKILYWWRAHPGSVAQDISVKEYAADAAKRAVHDFLRDYRHVEAVVESTRAFPTIFRIRYPLITQAKICIVIPNKDHINDLKRCIDSILIKTTYKNYEIMVVENNSESDEIFIYYNELKKTNNVRVLHYKGDFNFSKINNWAVKQCKADYIVLLHNDTMVITPDWLENMLMYAQREDVGAVGAKLYFPDGRIQHAGIALKRGTDVVEYVHYGVDRDNLGYMGRLCYAQDVSAVTAACLMVRKTIFDLVEGMDEKLTVVLNDVDFCLKIREKGYLNVFTPFAELYHYESTACDIDPGEKKERVIRERQMFTAKWKEILDAGDPYYNPGLSLDAST